jgi:hypothetical protein
MSIITRGALGYLAVMGVVVGVWAGAFPLAFYRHFPGFGRVWVAVDGPFNEHLVRDAGAAFLMLGALAATGLFRPALARPAAVGFATLCFNLPHFAYHLSHLGMFSPLDQALNVAALVSAVACSAWLLLPAAGDRASR